MYTAVLVNGTVGYVQIRSFMNLEEDAPVLGRFFKEVCDLPALIIDIRGNGGGLAPYWQHAIVGRLASEPLSHDYYITWRTGEYVQPFAMAKLSRMPSQRISKKDLVEKAGPDLATKIPPEVLGDSFVEPWVLPVGAVPAADSVGYKGEIYLLVDELCFSAAEGFASFCKATGFATVVGTWTGGDGIALTPAPVILPNSGMVVTFPTTMGLNPDFSANEETHTLPDVLVEQSLEDLLRYFDACSRGAVLRPDPGFDASLRACLELATGEAARSASGEL